MSDSASAPQVIHRLIGVYDADGTLRGELTYWIGKRLGRAHCALCDVTHGSVRERRDWRECRARLPVSFATFHRNDQPDAVRTATRGRAPVVLADTGDAMIELLGPDAIEACGASPQRLVDAVALAAEQHRLDWP
jgi:hypothetical protein